jgi:hypothetical protein
MGDPEKLEEFPDAEQRAAVCYSMARKLLNTATRLLKHGDHDQSSHGNRGGGGFVGGAPKTFAAAALREVPRGSKFAVVQGQYIVQHSPSRISRERMPGRLPGSPPFMVFERVANTGKDSDWEFAGKGPKARGLSENFKKYDEDQPRDEDGKWSGGSGGGGSSGSGSGGSRGRSPGERGVARDLRDSIPSEGILSDFSVESYREGGYLTDDEGFVIRTTSLGDEDEDEAADVDFDDVRDELMSGMDDYGYKTTDFRDTGLMTRDTGFVARHESGAEFQVTVHGAREGIAVSVVGLDEDEDEDEEDDGSLAYAMRANKRLTARITKVDEDQRLVSGWFSVIEDGGERVVDAQGDVISEAALVKAAHDFMRDSRAGKAMHQGRRAADVVESIVFTRDLQKALGIDLGKVGWFATMKVRDDEVWKRVKSGELCAFSIGGTGRRRKIG